jgi:membrane-bound lytic murein transglycosylase F
MLTRYHLIAALVLVGLNGCTPVDESVIKKAMASPGAELARSEKEGLSLEGASNAELDPEMRAFLKEYGPTIKEQATQYGLDWRLILAMVKQESRFSGDALSQKGASGLMQLMPTTGEELATELSLGDMQHPENNIRGGIHYLRTLYNLFGGAEESDRLKLALAAYNAGIGRVYDAQQIAAYLHESPSDWQSVKDALPLLSKRYYTLHKNIWEQEKPKSGWFGSARETVAYVDNVIRHYEELRLTLN